MKNLFKLLTILSLFLTSNLALAQEINAANSKPYVYCQIVSSSLLFKNKLNVNIDYGQERNFLGIDLIKTADNKKAVKFNSMIDALNYMSEQGWEFVQAYVIVDATDSTTYWILKKKRVIENHFSKVRLVLLEGKIILSDDFDDPLDEFNKYQYCLIY